LSGSNNTLLGYSAGAGITLGENVAVGANSLGGTAATQCVAVGAEALSGALASGANRLVAVGYNALAANTTGDDNTAVGWGALDINTDGVDNTAVGARALDANVSGDDNTGVGTDALTSTTGNFNTAVGSAAGSTITSGSNLTCLGYDAEPSDPAATNEVSLGNSSVDYIRFGAATTVSNTAPNPGVIVNLSVTNLPRLVIGHDTGASGNDLVSFYDSGSAIGAIEQDGAGGVSYTTASDARLKENIVALTGATTRLMALLPKRYNFIAKPTRTLDGFLAQDLLTVVPESAIGDPAGLNADGSINPMQVETSRLIPIIVAALQEQIQRNDVLEAALEALTARVAALET
jgi:hypothetical protein